MLRCRVKAARRTALVLALAFGGCMSQEASPREPSGSMAAPTASQAMVTVRYQVADINRASSFYTTHLGFHLAEKSGSAFGAVSRGGLRLILSGPGSSGSRPMPDGRLQEPGGWNRIVIYVDDLASQIQSLKKAGVRFRNEVEAGPGGKQILVEDPDGNPIELHEAPAAPKQ